MIRTLTLTIASTLALASAAAQDLTIINAKVWTGTEAGTLESAAIDIRDGEIVGLRENGTSPRGGTNDTSASGSAFSVALQASDGFNPAATTIPVTRIEGVTRIAVAPSNGSSMIAGQGFIADTSGAPNSITKDRAFVYIDLGEGGAGLAGGSRPAAWAALRGAFADARGYPARFMAHNEGDTLTRNDAQAFGRAVRGQQLILINAHRASDIRQIIELKNTNSNVKIAIVGAAEGWMVADELVEAGIPVIIDPFSNLPESFAQLGATSRNAERLIDAGVLTAFAHLGDNSHQARLVLQSAGNAVANGVSFDDAMTAITTAPAAIFELDALGTIELGNIGDLVVWDGNPLEVMSAPEMIIINGEAQSLESRQTKLRDRYLDLDESERPLAYKR